MKKYTKPELLNLSYSANCDIAAGGLENWLTDNSMSTYEESITTFEYNS